MEIVVDQHDGSGATAGKALDELDTILAVWTDWRAVMMTSCTGIDAGRLAELFADVVTPRECAGESAADPDNRFAWSFLTKLRIESDQFEDVAGLKLGLRRNPRNGFAGNEAEMLLPKVEQGQ